MKYLPFIILIAFTHSLALGKCTLPAPSDFSGTANSSCSISLSWSAVSGANTYSVRYKKSTSNDWITAYVGNVTTFTFNSLEVNTKYSFGVASVCEDGKTGAYSSTLKITTLTCSVPLSISISSVNTTSATATWVAACTESQYALRYKLKSVTVWTIIPVINSTTYVMSELEADKDYEAQVRSTCNTDTSFWTASTFFFTGNPSYTNIVMIMLDDARYDAFAPNGGPSYLNYAAIDRIANEGVNFKIIIPTSSLCTPSRGTILTGKYAHTDGAYKNGDVLDPNFFGAENTSG